MDRNIRDVSLDYKEVVALRKESVDRNTQRRDFKRLRLLSLSARRAWIEIIRLGGLIFIHPASLSARRAWIEITLFLSFPVVVGVALRKESVDRNELF